MIPRVQFRSLAHYKYLVTEDLSYGTNMRGFSVEISDSAGITLARLDTSGVLAVHRGYAWDGPSGPTIDTPDWMDASLVHDIFYQLIRNRQLPLRKRRLADIEMHRILIASGMPRVRAWYSYWAVRIFGLPAAHPRWRDLMEP